MKVASALVMATMFFSLISVPANAAGIHEAIRKNDILEVEAILRQSDGIAINSKIGSGVTPLHLAAAMNHKAIAGLLLCQGADVNSRTRSGFTPLHWAASKDAKETAKMLISFGANVNAKASQGITPLHYAAGKNATNIILRLMVAGARVNEQTEGGMEPLHWAVMKDADEAAILLAFKVVSEDMKQEAAAVERRVEVADASDVVEDVADQTEDLDLVADVEVADVEVSGEVHDILHIEEHGLGEEAIENVRPVSVVPRAEYGKSLVVPLGFNENLEFVWVEKMKLWVGKFEVTNGQYNRFKPKHRSLFRENNSLEGKSNPVVRVSWNDARGFCRWLNRNYIDRLPLDCSFRLPESSEWETFSRCGDDRVYPWGNKWPPAYGNFCDLSSRRIFSSNREGVKNYDDGFVVTCPVSESWSNEWGIYGLAGNVWEWCADWYDKSKVHKVRQGGSWDYDGEKNLRISTRGFDRPDVEDDTVGIRIVVSK